MLCSGRSWCCRPCADLSNGLQSGIAGGQWAIFNNFSDTFLKLKFLRKAYARAMWGHCIGLALWWEIQLIFLSHLPAAAASKFSKHELKCRLGLGIHQKGGRSVLICPTPGRIPRTLRTLVSDSQPYHCVPMLLQGGADGALALIGYSPSLPSKSTLDLSLMPRRSRITILFADDKYVTFGVAVRQLLRSFRIGRTSHRGSVQDQFAEYPGS